GPTVLERLSGAIELDGIAFAYTPGGPHVLDDIALNIRAGEKVAVVGRTGSGKSTLARLLLGMHQPVRGHVRFDGKDLQDLDLVQLRRRMGVVLQETFLFDDTIRANVCLGRGEVSPDDLEQAAWLSCIDEFVARLPEGLETRIS